MKQILLILAVVAVVGCGKEEAPEPLDKAPAAELPTARVVDGPNSSSRQWPYLPNEFIPLDKFIVNYHPLTFTAADGKVSLLELNAETSDIELKHLTGMADVMTEEVHLTFSHSQITDAGLKELAKMKNLASIDLIETQVTDAGVAELKKALPNCEIQYTAKK